MENQYEEYENNEQIPQEPYEVETPAPENIEVATVKFEGCARHNDLPFVGECLTCGKQICRECRAERGYFCSDECREASRSTVDTAAREEFRKNQASTEKIVKIFKICTLVVTLIVVFIVGKWVYKEFLDPAGSIVWQWEVHPPAQDFFLIGHKDGKALVKREKSTFFIDLENGKEISTAEDKRLGECKELVTRLKSGGAILRNERVVGMLKSDGSLGWIKRFKEPITRIVVVDGDAVLVMTTPDRELFEKLRPEDITSDLTVFDLKNGGRRWKKEFTNFTYVYDLVAGGGKYIKAVSIFTKEKSEAYLEVCDLKTGKAEWKIKSKKSSGSNLMVVGDLLLFRIQNVLSAVDLQTKKKLWQIPMKGWGWKNNIKIEGDKMLIDNGQSLLCVNPHDGKKIWEKKMPESLVSVTYADGRIYSIFVEYEETEEKVEEVKVELPPSFDQIKDVDVLSGGKPTKARVKTTSKSFLSCQDMADGKELWKTENVKGTCVAGNGKLVVLTDTQQLTLMNVSNDGMGSIIIRQFNPENGKELFDRVDGTGLAGPYFIFGNKLVGCEYERTRAGVGGLQLGQDKAYFGLASFLLK